MALSRVIIKTNENQPGRKETIQASAEPRVFFNPTQYQIQRQVQWEELPGKKGQTPLLQYKGGGPRSLSMSLLFDTYESKEDVRKYTGQIARLAEKENDDRPPICTILWGKPDTPASGLPFTGVLESLTQKFTLFLDDGTPVRATLDVQFKESVSAERQQKVDPGKKRSPIQARLRIVREGDSLWAVAAAEYGSAAQWRPIAEANGITNPRQLRPGAVLVIPPLE